MKNIDFPFKSTLNLSPLIKFWEYNLTSTGLLEGYPSEYILDQIDSVPALKSPIEDVVFLQKHRQLVGLLMSAVIPPAQASTDLSAAILPFKLESFHSTIGFRKLFPRDSFNETTFNNMPEENMVAGKTMRACMLILNKFYGTDIKGDKPLMFHITDVESGLDKVYKVEIDDRFIEIIKKGDLKPIHNDEIKYMCENLYNVDLWLKYIEADNFEFQGFMLFRLIDVTVQEMLSSIKYDLLKKDAVIKGSDFDTIQKKMQSVFGLPELKLGLAAFNPKSKLITTAQAGIWNSIILHTDVEISCESCIGSIYDRVYTEQRPIIIDDLTKYQGATSAERALIQQGIRNIVVAPLFYDKEMIGFLELATPYARKITPFSVGQLENVLPMFTSAVTRVLHEMKTGIRALIQEECTAIHPVVEWRFMEAGINLMNNRLHDKNAEMEAIIFHDVYPIYGLSDIRNSSFERNIAIQQDLQENLRQAKNVLKAIRVSKKMPILDEMIYKIGLKEESIKSGLGSGDESGVQSFLKELTPKLRYFKDAHPELVEVIEKYQQQLDPQLGVIYKKRKAFEESLTKINETISAYLDEVEVEAQQAFPHYFEKYKSDGVEYNIYLGNSLVEDRKFDTIYLKNFKLWQFIVMCEIGREMEKLKPRLANALSVAQLILVQSEPLSIRFRRDEKKFDVDGAYNIRYEIVKKRIDKAYIKGTKERLTQPGKIAIVYARASEASIYEEFIEYLIAIGYLKKRVEHLELQELQGANGLKALRVELNFNDRCEDFSHKVLQRVAKNIEKGALKKI